MSKKFGQEVPSNIRIGGFDYDITSFPGMEGSKHGMLACHYGNNLEIQYQDDVKDQQKVHLLLHEALHGVFYTTGLHDDFEEEEEELVTRIALSLTQIIRDNPEFLVWAYNTLSGEKAKKNIQVVPS